MATLINEKMTPMLQKISKITLKVQNYAAKVYFTFFGGKPVPTLKLFENLKKLPNTFRELKRVVHSVISNKPKRSFIRCSFTSIRLFCPYRSL